MPVYPPMPLDDLSAELVLSIIELLPFPDVSSILQLNHDWYSFVQLHQSSIYRHCAVLHGFVAPGLSLNDATGVTHDSIWLELIQAGSWRAYCKLLVQTTRYQYLSAFRSSASFCRHELANETPSTDGFFPCGARHEARYHPAAPAESG